VLVSAAAHFIPQFPQAAARGFTLVQMLVVVTIVGVLSSITVPSYRAYVERARNTQAVGDIGDIEIAINRFATTTGNLPPDLAAIGAAARLDPWGNAYRYVNFAGGGMPRTDQAGLPVNDDYDLYSLGMDGATAASLMDDASRDDIVRASNGGFYGLVPDYSRLD
jgi:general secretion pathway protein G